MGSSDRLKEGGRPRQLFPTGEPITTGDLLAEGLEGQVEDAEELLFVWLVRLDPKILAATSIEDTVTIERSGDALRVMTPSGRLGDIPPHSSERVMRLGVASGVVKDLLTHPLKAQVQLVR